MDRVRKRIKNPMKKTGAGKGSSKDLSKIGLSRKTLGIEEDQVQEVKEDEFKGWGSWGTAEVIWYVNKRLGNHGELLGDAGYTGAKMVEEFRDNPGNCKQFFRDKGKNPSIGKSLQRYLKNDLNAENKAEQHLMILCWKAQQYYRLPEKADFSSIEIR